jgi:hypothetical protein
MFTKHEYCSDSKRVGCQNTNNYDNELRDISNSNLLLLGDEIASEISPVLSC